MNTMIWLIRREFWENRAIWWMPAGIGMLLVLIALFGQVHLDADDIAQIHAAKSLHGSYLAAKMFLLLSSPFLVVMGAYASWYLLDCLYADRRDRSVLFWKSLPISDTATVLSKLAMGLIVIPLVYFAFALLTTLLLAFILSMRLTILLDAGIWSARNWLDFQMVWLYIVATLALWFLPVAAWVMLVSAWARRAVLLWTTLPLLAVMLLEHYFLSTDWFMREIWLRISYGYLVAAFSVDNATFFSPASGLRQELNPLGFVTEPQTLIGIAVGAALLIATVQLRLRRTES
jgi:ABC-2 type transport system permease protein